MVCQWAETPVEIMGTLADIRGTTKYTCHFPNINLTSLYVQKRIIIYVHICSQESFAGHWGM